MSLENVKVGDKLRYLGCDVADLSDRLTEGEEYVVKKLDKYGNYIIENPCAPHVKDWIVFKDGYNSACFEPVRQQLDIKSDKDGDDGKDKDKEGRIDLDDVIKVIVKLSQEVAKLKRELSELRRDVQAQAYEDNERIERILDDIVMLDERTQGVNNEGQKLLSKEVYIYDTE